MAIAGNETVSSSSFSSETPKYKLSRELVGHEAEVLSLSVFENGNIVSTSKDKTARLWEEKNGTYVESVVMTGHSDFVCSVCVIDPTDKNPTGFIVTGGYDRNICIYYPGEDQPVHTVVAHEGIVCHLRTSIFEAETFLSSSADNTGKLWDLYDLKKPMAIYSGHAANSTVWCISDLGNGLVITGASDKVVLIYERKGNILHKLTGHSSCVIDIAAISNNDFLTCSNDHSILLWNVSHGTFMEKYIGHCESVNSITVIDGGMLAVSCGKDQTVRVWQMGKIKQIIAIPSETVWNVKLLANKDIVCSSSDNIIRIFTTDSSRFINDEAMHKHKEKVDEIIKKLKNKVDIQPKLREDKIPLEKELNEPGKKDGDTVIVRRGDKVKVYRWSHVNYQWQLVGDVLEDKTGISKKPMYNGIEYDYVFSVDIMKNAPLLKLPYNKGQDPYEAANLFLEENDLSSDYLDQVANFIMTNVQLKSVINDEVSHQNPFAANKYISNSWSTDQVNTTPDQSVTKSYIPLTNYLKIEQGNIALIQNKLLDFNKGQEIDNQSTVPQDKIESLINLVKPESSTCSKESMSIMMSLLEWPDDIVFPVLDIARLAVLQKNVNKVFCENGVLSTLKRHLQTSSSATNQMLTFRLLANLFSHEAGEQFCLQTKDEVLEAIAQLSDFGNKHTEIAISTYILNLIVALNKNFDMVGKEKILKVVSSFFEMFKDNEAIFRTLVGIGTIIVETKNSEIRKSYIQFIKNSKPILKVLLKFVDESGSGKVPIKIHQVSKNVIKLIR